MVLDNRAKKPIESIVGNQQILELIEADNGEFTVSVGQDTGDIEQFEKSSTSLISSYPRRLWGDGKANSGCGSDYSQTGGPTTNAATRLARKFAVRVSDTNGYIRDRRHLGEIDSHGAVANFSHRDGVSFEQAALAEPARGSETDGDTVGSRLLECVQLDTPVY